MALAVSYSVAFVRSVSGFRVHAGLFAERHCLVVIIALGESIVAVGVGASGVGLGPAVLVAVVLGIALAAALWWAYFDLARLSAERRLTAARGEERARQARDSYSYLHLPMVAGIIFSALGIEQTLAHVGEPLGTIPAVALCGGIALYLLGAQRLQATRRGQCERAKACGGGPVLGVHPRRGNGLLDPHPRRPGVGAVWAGSI